MRLLMSLVCSRSRKPLSLQCHTKRLGIRDDQWGRRLSDSLKEPCAVPYHHPTLWTGERFVRTRDQDISALFDQLLELSAGDQNHRVDRVVHEDRLGTMHIRGFTDIANGLWE